ncbi:DUF2218 domain-containing protein [Caulobacter mirabilis]|uniref:2,4-dihydroxyhept-2-ene-1,7-dioic acid aldolase n=1 Tax=Caulobacter mirabilis TaxID=69666 RepID=A0A2D2B2I1_9CAUL|nr:DUF2218 domain-containing protein [Caulobacter mirabilis]ATQ44454.1 2,4-dihydroxyhept-2-ene-1,7-dioic acid aldolase [Caulobacter mirabilis]
MQSIASVSTAHAARYMTQLCKHWAHKFPVTFDEASGRIELPLGLCRLTVGPGVLGVVLEAADDAGLLRLEDVVADHVNRFAHREGELAFAWTRTA